MDKDELTCKLLKTLDLVAMLEQLAEGGDMNACSGGIRHVLDGISAELIDALEGIELLGEEK